MELSNNGRLVFFLAIGFFFFYALNYPNDAAPVVRHFGGFVVTSLRTLIAVADTAANG